MTEPTGEEPWTELEDDWEELKAAKSPILIVTAKPDDLKSQMELAYQKTAYDLAQYAKRYDNTGTPLTEVLVDITAKAVRTFMGHWYKALRGQNLAGLLELVLEGQDLTPTEMKEFLQALPTSLLQKVVSSAIGSATGTHALVAVEYMMRQRSVRNYRLLKEGSAVVVTFVDPVTLNEVRFTLDETFKGLSELDPDRPATM